MIRFKVVVLWEQDCKRCGTSIRQCLHFFLVSCVVCETCSRRMGTGQPISELRVCQLAFSVWKLIQKSVPAVKLIYVHDIITLYRFFSSSNQSHFCLSTSAG